MTDLTLIIVIIIQSYLVQAVVCCTIHAFCGTRSPQSKKDFIKLTFLPYILIKWKKVRNHTI